MYNLVVLRRLRWHGFLTLPLLPIYGFSALGIVLLVTPYIHNPFFVFVAAVVVVSVIEYLTSVVLQYVFRVRLWDYTDWPYDLQGRISLFSSLGFGALGLMVAYVLQPALELVTSGFARTSLTIVMLIVFGLVLIDFINSTASLARLRVDLTRLPGSLDDIQEHLAQRIHDLSASNKRARAAFIRWQRYNMRQLRRAFPRITPMRRK